MLVTGIMVEQKCYRVSFLVLLQLETCVYSLILKLCFTFMLHVFCMFQYHVAYHTISQVANKVQTHFEAKIRVHKKEKKLSLTQNQEMQQELEAMKVIVTYKHKVYSIIRSY